MRHGAGQQIVLADEVRDESAPRFFVERLGRSHLLDPAVPEHRHPVRHHHGFLLVVGNVDDGHPQFTLNAADLELHLFAQPPVQGTEGFVHQHQVGLEHQRPGDGDALLLAAGQLPRPAVLEALQLHEIQRTLHPLGPFRSRQVAHFQRERQVAAYRHVREQRVVLEHHADTAFVRGKVLYGDAVDEDRAGGSVLEPGEHHETRRLAGSRGTEQGQEFALVDLEVQILDDPRPTVVALLDVLVFDVRCAGSHDYHHLPRRTGRYPARASIKRSGSSSTMIPSTCSRRTNPSPWTWRRYLRSVSK